MKFSSVEIAALTFAARSMRDHSIDISLPWEGDLDDLELDRFKGLVAGCHAYADAIQVWNSSSQGRTP